VKENDLASLPMHRSRRRPVALLHEASKNAVPVHELVGALLGRGEVVLHRFGNSVVRNSTTTIRDSAIKQLQI
jgi:hypothetical protein